MSEVDAVVLNDRERQMLELAASGLTNAAIATKMGFAPVTANRVLSQLYTRMGVRDRSQAVAVALINRLIDPATVELPAQCRVPSAGKAVTFRLTANTTAEEYLISVINQVQNGSKLSGVATTVNFALSLCRAEELRRARETTASREGNSAT